MYAPGAGDTGPDIPILAATAMFRPADLRAWLDVGCNDYILKPFQPDELLARLRRFVPILGYEWTAWPDRGGHHNVFFRDPSSARVGVQDAMLERVDVPRLEVVLVQ